ncbi:hypothetical protein CL614_06375 [archaeon]|nr:hypothetical protein [archaeon]|tara:strand:+ start:650 stop:1819 length:1170 start_codon:yes stop_codon:yes gene_type:complete
MVSKSIQRKIAKKVVEAMNMKVGETLAIRGGTHTQDLVEEMALIAAKQGVEVGFRTSSDNFVKRIYKEVPQKYLARASKMAMHGASVLDNRIYIESPKDPRITGNIPHKLMGAISKANKPLSEKYDKLKIKGVIVGWPTRELASQLGCSYKTLERIIIKGMLVDWKVLNKKGNILKKKLKGADFVHIHDEYGTDLRLKMGNRKIMIADGYASDQDLVEGDVWQNLPDGETFTTPIETYAEGTLVSPYRRDYFTNKPIKGIKLVFEKGKLNLQKTKAEQGNAILHKTLKQAIAIDKKTVKVLRTTHPAELGIGTNPVIDQIIGYLLTDEKIGGTIHVAIGKNNPSSYGGKSDSVIHWDFITNKGVNVDVIKKSRGKEIITPLLSKGKLAK